MLTYKGTTCTYDVENRLTAYGSALTCGYRGDGLRAWKQPNGGSKTYFLYDGEVLACELDSSGNVSAVPTFGPAGLVSRRSGSTTTYMHFDSQGGLSQTTDGSGNVVASYGWDAYGTALNGSAGVYGYGAQWGYYTDAETGLQLCTYRMYDPAVGRFLTRDPIGYAGGVNLYGYCGSNPAGGADPRGLAARMQENRGGWEKTWHVWLQFDRGEECSVTWDAGRGAFGSFGFYPFSGGAGDLPIQFPEDPETRMGRLRQRKSSADPAFVNALCWCIQQSISRGPGKWLWKVHDCGDWAEDMWACAKNRAFPPKHPLWLREELGYIEQLALYGP